MFVDFFSLGLLIGRECWTYSTFVCLLPLFQSTSPPRQFGWFNHQNMQFNRSVLSWLLLATSIILSKIFQQNFPLSSLWWNVHRVKEWNIRAQLQCIWTNSSSPYRKICAGWKNVTLEAHRQKVWAMWASKWQERPQTAPVTTIITEGFNLWREAERNKFLNYCCDHTVESTSKKKNIGTFSRMFSSWCFCSRHRLTVCQKMAAVSDLKLRIFSRLLCQTVCVCLPSPWQRLVEHTQKLLWPITEACLSSDEHSHRASK